MSGVIFTSGDGAGGDSVETPCWNPLQCNICSEQYKDPCILPCYHSFCTMCILAKLEDGKITCPICGCVSQVKEGSPLPSPDPLLKFLVESSQNDRVPCANCDKAEAQMFFCNTCCQALCLSCREETHRARMFTTHDIVLLTKRAKEIQKECKLHKEPFILFSTEKKIMLCINCFRDMKVESRSHCVDLETAYKQGCQKLNNTMQSIRDLQHSVKETILLLKALLGEIEQNAEREKQDILSLFNSIEKKISETKVTLLQEIERQYEEKERLFKNQLVHLTTFLPTLHVHLVTCAAFCSTANKYEFLDFTYVLMERLKSIIQVQHPLHPSQGSDIFTDHKTQFAKCLEPLLFPHGGASPMSVPVSIATNVASQRLETLPALPSTTVDITSITYKPVSNGGHRYNKNSAKFKHLDTTGYFADHCKEFDTVHRELMQNVEGLKLGVQELQRDLTLRRCMAKDAAIGALDEKISEVEESLVSHLAVVEQKQPGLEKHWEECLEKIAGEQEVYRAQIQDVLRLKQETQSVKTILHRLSSFVSSIANVTQRLAPKLSLKQKEDTHTAMLQEINTMQPDSQHRVDAIRTAQEEREFKAGSRTNPLDEELIKTKGLLKAPLRSDCKDPSKRESREISDAIAELEEERQAKEDRIRKETSTEYKKNDTQKKRDTCNSEVKIKGATIAGNEENDNSPGDTNIKNKKTESLKTDQTLNLTNEGNADQHPAVVNESDKLSLGAEKQRHDVEQTDRRKFETADEAVVKDSDTERKNVGLSDLDLIQTSAVVVPDVNVELNSSGASDCSAEFTFDAPNTGTASNMELNKDDKNSTMDRNKAEQVAGNSPRRKRLSTSISGSESDNKQEDSDTNEHDIVDVFGVKQLKHVERPAVNHTANGIDGSASSGDDDVYIAKSLPELAQVFEPGDLKPKRHSRRNDGSRSPNPTKSEP